MGSLSGVRERRILKAAHEQIAKEIEELTESVGMSRKSLIDRALLGEDDELRDELQRRFEQGKPSGKFPLLSWYLSDLSDEEKEEFFRTGWLRLGIPPAEPQKKPWEHAPYNGDERMYRVDLYEGMAFMVPNLRMFAQEWLEELARVGYHGITESFGLPLKERRDGSAISRPVTAWPYEAYPVLFENTREVLWLQLDGERSINREYKEPVVSNEPLRTDKAILAVLTALEGNLMDIERLRKALPELKLPLEEPMWKQWYEAVEDLPEVPSHRGDQYEEYRRQRDKQIAESNIPGGLQYPYFLDYVLLLLRHHRQEFDDLPHEEKLALIAQTCAYVNEFLETLRKFMAFLEYGVPGRHLKSAVKYANRDVKAAILRDVDKLTYRKIGEELGVPLPKDFHDKGDHPTVRQMVKRGRSILERALGKEGWQEHIGRMKSEAKRRRSLSEVERDAEDTAESLGMPYEEALRRIEEDEARRRSKDKPEIE